ncbi:GNAT family N-acetyltransferase [Labilibaculum sp. K2S]|uniref:GNAT family N-acetyltransferase n=1 Tax=Labilibaculum sp. K2S TaxID=3056386 RepID=UPI0025A49DE0|nr:GNAT family N-acetyltransferase [Labilibaculum sp. K2S]MDM8160645.1 GNAT family N-acetyltransferase [Labilibaculum sp. K2S]
MKRTRLTPTNTIGFLQAWELYEDAFPEEERRELELQQQIMKNANYHFDIATVDGVFVGFILWWQFAGLRYIEHLATPIEYRGKGYGKCIVEQFLSQTSEAILLEVELPNCDTSKRRIAFYERLGFKLNTIDYKQLPMRKNGISPEMFLMTYPDGLTAVKLSFFKKSFKRMCYAPYFE